MERLIDMETNKVHRESGKKWVLPEVLYFFNKGNSGNYFYEIIGFQKPVEYDWYLSEGLGSTLNAYKASNALSMDYLVIKPTDKVVTKTIWVKESYDKNKSS